MLNPSKNPVISSRLRAGVADDQVAPRGECVAQPCDGLVRVVGVREEVQHRHQEQPYGPGEVEQELGFATAMSSMSA